MLVSIIITNYNYGKFIHRCLRSCINQSIHENSYEIIVVDDKSNDNSIKIYRIIDYPPPTILISSILSFDWI